MQKLSASSARPSGITSGGWDIRGLRAALDESVDGEIRFDEASRAAYSTDSSNYRQVPIAVVVPHCVDAAVDAIAVCTKFGVPLLSRGGGTSLAGQCCNTAVVIDWSKYCNRLVSLDVDARIARVEPGIVLDELNRALAPHGLQYGPKPATHSHCTIGGMIGNNSCGSSAQAYGKTVDNVERLEIATDDGERMWVGATDDTEFERIIALGGRRADLYRGMREIAERCGDEVRAGFPRIPRRVSGYNLDELLPENGFNVARALVGSESTLATMLHADLDLVALPKATSYIVLGFPTMTDAGDVASVIARHDPLMIEGFDSHLVEDERRKEQNLDAISLLPEGEGWLVVQFPGDDQPDADRKAETLVAELAERDITPIPFIVHDTEKQRKLTRFREMGLGAAAWVPGLPDMWAGWDDAAVPPERLGDYLRDFADLLERFDYRDVARYGHFGQGCVHARIPFELTTKDGIDTFGHFLETAACLIVSYGGSISGEHGDGQARGALLKIMFGERIIDAFGELKSLFDPRGLMNPGKVIDALPPTQSLRLGTDYRPKVDVKLQFSFPLDQGRFDRAALRCVGIGECRSHSGGVMCPSYRATGEEVHSTRGRARILSEMLEAHDDSAITSGWRSDEVAGALDLCLSCKGCKSDCPVGVDMATYKAEFLSHRYAGRIRPASHYSMGWLPRWARLVHLAPGLVNRLAHAGPLSRLGKRVAGIEQARPIPWFANERFTDWFHRRPPRGPVRHGDVLLWPDSFTNNLHPAVGRAAVDVLEHAGYRVVIPEQVLCCGLTWISTGQLDSAKRMLRGTAHAIAPLLASMPLVSLEPSCTAVFRSDAPELLPDDPDIAVLAQATHTLAELLADTPDFEPPVVGGSAVVQPHCHQHAVLGFDADAALLERMQVHTTIIGGCCGLAGNFGFEVGHLDVSIACAEQELLPAIRAAGDDDIILADGFSCRTQVDQAGNGRRAVHLAELLAAGLSGYRPRSFPERGIADRPGPHERIPARVISAAVATLPSPSTGRTTP